MRTYAPTICRERCPARVSTQAGFSLIEILVVVGMMALITGMMVPSFVSAFRVSGESFTKKVALILGQARDRAMLTDKLVRLKIDLEKQVLSLDETPSQYLVPKVAERSMSEREKEELEKKEGEAFRPLTELMKEPLKVPDGLKVVQVKSARYKKPVTEGIATVYFFNNGQTDGATIYFESDEKTHATIHLHPVTGLSRLDAEAPGTP